MLYDIVMHGSSNEGGIGDARKRRLGVWFSIALAILVLSAWVGWKLGARIAVSSYRSRQQRLGTLSPAERAHVESMLSDLGQLQLLQLYVSATYDDIRLRKKYLVGGIEWLESLRRQSNTHEIKPVLEFNLGIAYVGAATAEEQDNNKEQASTYMKSAQTLFQSLGWRDYSETTLKSVAQREFGQWSSKRQSTVHDK